MSHRSILVLLVASALSATWAATHNIYLMIAQMEGAPDGFKRSMLGMIQSPSMLV